MDGTDEGLIQEQIAYYQARAGEYDLLYEQRDDWRELLPVLERMPIHGDVLELACGTGAWTARLAERARSVTALDASPEALALARERVPHDAVSFTEADLFAWRPERRYDTVFFGFWLSHVPPARFAAFWDTVAQAVAPGGAVVFFDTGRGEAASEQVLADASVPSVSRRLEDGREYRVVKVFRDEQDIRDSLTALGWSAEVSPVGDTLLAGLARPPADTER
ncbi:class I SAM-dependent methyltransferase [Actinospica durhamensis]|uniref:Class I SAM-dependent methyltransferase n=1 Tax=Actinospica durhamensis TaxID=1508375 RepID=A0A941IQS5_9ACTN|nr:class I SAM-dependent methyltransferase [Actinospica durhamensis]MBR7833233.1 class I SAM-dependent methyltransferase [Actinospica durhamensis]